MLKSDSCPLNSDEEIARINFVNLKMRERKWGKRLWRSAQILRYYPWARLAQRAWKVIRRRIQHKFIGDIKLVDMRSSLVSAPAFREIAECNLCTFQKYLSHVGADLRNGRVVILSESREMGVPWNWDVSCMEPKPSHLWKFQLHYHEYLLSSLADNTASNASENVSCEVIETILLAWVERYTPQRTTVVDDAWHPYCISRRIPVWLTLLSLKKVGLSVSESMKKSISLQAEYLARNLERDIGGNHLLENLTSLALLEIAMPRQDARVRVARILQAIVKELGLQVLPHGEHFERSPVYHCQILANILQAAYLSKDVFREETEQLLFFARKMYAFIEGIVHPDGEVPLLGDSVFYESASMVRIRKLASMNGIEVPLVDGSSLAIHGPYYVFKSKSMLPDRKAIQLIVDHGEVGARELPAHAHCDLMNLELSCGGQRWITDSGNFDYEDSIMRSYCRSSIAHNVVTIDRLNHCEIWSKFRMGRRGRVREVFKGESCGVDWVAAKSDAYRFMNAGLLCRLNAVSENGVVLCADWLEGPLDSSHQLEGFLHFAPDVEVIRNDENQERFYLRRGNERIELHFFGCRNVQVTSSWYCPAFSVRKRRSALTYSMQASEKHLFGWIAHSRAEFYSVSTNESGIILKNNKSKSTFFEWKRSCI